MILRLIKLHVGLALFSLAISLMVKANIGVSPWDVFHQGISNVTGMSFGTASIVVGLAILVVSFALKERIGYGTLSNMVIIGLIIDWIFAIDLIPQSANLWVGLGMLLLGMVLTGFASFLYISAAFGAGPRDSMMVALVKRTGRSVGTIRTLIELTALCFGYLMGGQVGIGTLILALGIGPTIQYIFKLMAFDIKTVQHQWLFGGTTRGV